MVGGRRRALETTGSYGNGNGNGNNKNDNGYDRGDLESAYGSINKIKPQQRFRDAIQNTIQDNRIAEMKKHLIDKVDHDALEIYRKSEESVSIFDEADSETGTDEVLNSSRPSRTKRFARFTKSRTLVLMTGPR